MARKSKFDRDEKLRDAMALFWRKGYANTAISDLIETLQINRFSLYNSYGDKQNLYYLALDAYLQQISFPSIAPLMDAQAGWPHVKQFLLRFAKRQRESSCGCFMQNALVEHGGDDPNVLKQGHRLFDLLLSAFTAVFERETTRQNIHVVLPAPQLASLLLSQMQGMRVLSKAKRFADIDLAVTGLITLIEGEKDGQH